ncbi:hypothetical protein LP422_20870 [Janibacter limosus]|uniref:Uncharacterized protein n=1 Tax=Janibacter limosus TaxID=53458 RepID=A0AC61U3Y4_9MICO|nr:hypothetical protein [Janibacter limosus]UUZ44722.1 hypothetical protein LP422_20870 [Janibacter limosus]
MTAHAPRRRLSRIIHGSPAVISSTRQIPQLLPRELYEAHLTGLFTSRPETIRLFASLTMARTHPGVATRADAAENLGLPADLGRRCAAAAASSQTASPMAVLSAVSAAARDLDRRDYRAPEGRVRALASSDAWFSTRARRYRPRTRTTTQPLALQWLWTHVAHAHPGTAPEASPTRARRFATTLTAEQQQALRQVLDEPTPPRNPETS